MLVGRYAEHGAVARLLARAQGGQSSVLVVRGEAGIGKTVLLQHVREAAVAAGFRVEGATGVELEAHFAFAGLHQLCAAMLARASALPEPQQAALWVAFGMRKGAAPDPFLVGLAVLSLLAEVAEDGPLLCLVDDAQWLDQASAQVLAFVARRVASERVVLVFALRDSGDGDGSAFLGLPDLRLVGLSDSDARALLAATVGTPLDDAVLNQVLTEARGNPLALLELPRAVTPGRLANVVEIPDASHVASRVEDGFRRRSSLLSADTQALLLVAAADPTGEAELLWRAATHLGIAREAAAPAEAAGLWDIDTRVRFRHPLVRSAIYRAAAAPDRRRAHEALAAAIDPQVDPERRAWHRGQAVLGTDEEVAAELERSAGRARARGGSAAAATFLQRSAELTAELGLRARRALDAAFVHYEAGAPEAARELLAVAAAGPVDGLHHGRLELLRAQIAFHTSRGSDVPGMFMDAARTLGPLDASLAREAYLQAVAASLHAGRFGGGDGVLGATDAGQFASPSAAPPRPVDLLLDGMATRSRQGYEAGTPVLQRALRALIDDDCTDAENLRWLLLGCHAAATLWDDAAIFELADRNVRLARRAGALATLPAALNVLASVLVLTGELARAGELIAEEQAITDVTGAPRLPQAGLTLASWSGREVETVELYAAVVQDATKRGEGATVSSAEVCLAYLHNGLGNYDAALAAAAAACADDELGVSSVALPELVEAAVRAGQPARAAAALEQLSSRARASGTAWAMGLAARSQALISSGSVAEEHYREAIEQLRRCRMATHLARAHLVYGEWLRREGRRQAARQQLRIAHGMLSGMGAEAFAARAGRELRVTGEHPRSRTAQPSDALTAQELQIARMVATGATSREVGAQLFLSPRTIETHLRNIFRKLDLTSRRQLRDLQLP